MTVRRLVFDAFVDDRGCLIPIEHANPELLFVPVRSFVISGVPAGQNRANHTLTCHQILILICGRVNVIVRNGATETRYPLERPGEAVYLAQGTWISLRDFTGDAVLFVLASGPYIKR